KEPDLVFLIVAEHKMAPFFRNALLYSYVSQLYMILLAGAVLGPLYFHSFPNRSGSIYLLSLVVLLVFICWNLIANLLMLKFHNITSKRISHSVRIVLNIVVFYFIIYGSMGWAGIVTILFIGLFFYTYILSQKQAGNAWDILVEKDQN